MPTPQEFFVAQASCLWLLGLHAHPTTIVLAQASSLWRKGTKLGKVE
ncbi:hypothetical protein [Microcoleus sp. Pol11C3]